MMTLWLSDTCRSSLEKLSAIPDYYFIFCVCLFAAEISLIRKSRHREAYINHGCQNQVAERTLQGVVRQILIEVYSSNDLTIFNPPRVFFSVYKFVKYTHTEEDPRRVENCKYTHTEEDPRRVKNFVKNNITLEFKWRTNLLSCYVLS